MKSTTRWLSGLAAGALLAASIRLVAGPVSVPNAFTSGTPARAADVNANFSAVATAINDNSSRLSSLEAGARSPDLAPTGNLVLGPSIATAGNILKGTDPFIHSYGSANTFVGVNAGNFTMTGARNTAGGNGALSKNTAGHGNSAIGADALGQNTAGFQNTANGDKALFSNTSGNENTAVGYQALWQSTTATGNTALGAQALWSNTSGGGNTAIGGGAMLAGTGEFNTAIGLRALRNSTGGFNAAVGSDALSANTLGLHNIAVGDAAGFNLTTGSYNIDIGHKGVAGEAATIRIGTPLFQTRTFIAGIRGNTAANGNAIPVVVDSDGQLGTANSSRSVKDTIADMGTASSPLMQLRPVTFYYKTDQNLAGRVRQYGLVAEEVADVAPDLVAHSADGTVETVYYQFLSPMLLNEYQKQQHTIAALASRVAELEQRNEALERLVTQALAANGP